MKVKVDPNEKNPSSEVSGTLSDGAARKNKNEILPVPKNDDAP